MLTALMGSAPAIAGDYRSYVAGAAYAYSYGTNTKVAVKNTGTSDQVYANYRRGSSNELTLWGSDQSGVTAYSSAGSVKVTSVQACVDDAFWDTCGSWDGIA
ncbi:hypothetical protein ACFYNW_34330 [Streptomyces virginiae]|uniref:hypothetical protein n=1 Tax=Streptomyces virginiae TaxID=1961 RepID=UPI0036E2D09D